MWFRGRKRGERLRQIVQGNGWMDGLLWLWKICNMHDILAMSSAMCLARTEHYGTCHRWSDLVGRRPMKEVCSCKLPSQLGYGSGCELRVMKGPGLCRPKAAACGRN